MHIDPLPLFYGVFALLALGTALGVVIARNPVYSAINLVGCMVALAGLFLMMNQEFVFFIQILVYAGAIVVLFLFVITILNLREPDRPGERLLWVRVLGSALALALILQVAFAARTILWSEQNFMKDKDRGAAAGKDKTVPNETIQAAQADAAAVDAAAETADKAPAGEAKKIGSDAFHILGTLMITQYVLPFELTSILLLVAILGAVILARRRMPSSEEQYAYGYDEEEDALAEEQEREAV